MKMVCSIFIAFCCLCSGCFTESSQTKTLSIGVTKVAFDRLVAETGARDITSQLAIVDRNGKHPMHGIVWELPMHQCVISVRFEGGRLSFLDFCPLSDFEKSKAHSEASTLTVTKVVLHPDNTVTCKQAE